MDRDDEPAERGSRRRSSLDQEGAYKVKRTRRRARLVVSADGENIVSHVGARLLSDLADAVDLTAGLAVAMAPTKQRHRGWSRGEVLVDRAVMIADGGDAISDLGDRVIAHVDDLGAEPARPTPALHERGDVELRRSVCGRRRHRGVTTPAAATAGRGDGAPAPQPSHRRSPHRSRRRG